MWTSVLGRSDRVGIQPIKGGERNQRGNEGKREREKMEICMKLGRPLKGKNSISPPSVVKVCNLILERTGV